MRSMFCFLSFSIFGGTRKTGNTEMTPEEKASDRLDTPERRAATNALAVKTKSISERKTISLGTTLSRIWSRLKYDSELSKARSDCKRFLASLSSPHFELSTVVPLCRPLGDLVGKNLNDLYEENINDTIKKFAAEAGRNGQLEKIKSNLNINLGKFDSSRQKSYGRPFNMAVECKKALEIVSGGNPAQANWTIDSKSSTK